MPDVLDTLSTRLGNPKEALERRHRMDESIRFALDNMEEWRTKHPNSWIAVWGQKLVAAENSRERLLEKLRKERVPLGEVYVDFLSEGKALLVL